MVALGICNLFCNAVKQASTKKAPGAITKIETVSKFSGQKRKLKIEPLPKISRTIPIQVSPKVNPSPIPIPSNKDGTTLFFDA